MSTQWSIVVVRQPNRDFWSNLAREYPQWGLAYDQDLPNEESEWCHLYFSILTMVAMKTCHFLEMLNYANLASLGLLMWKVLGCIICKSHCGYSPARSTPSAARLSWWAADWRWTSKCKHGSAQTAKRIISSVVSFTQCSPTCGRMPLPALSLWPGRQPQPRWVVVVVNIHPTLEYRLIVQHNSTYKTMFSSIVSVSSINGAFIIGTEAYTINNYVL